MKNLNFKFYYPAAILVVIAACTLPYLGRLWCEGYDTGSMGVTGCEYGGKPMEAIANIYYTATLLFIFTDFGVLSQVLNTEATVQFVYLLAYFCTSLIIVMAGLSAVLSSFGLTIVSRKIALRIKSRS